MTDKLNDAAAGDEAGKSEKPSTTSDVSASAAEEARSTTTKANGGTRSSPPRVVGNGSGEAKDVKAKSAAAARENATEADTVDDSR